MTNGKVMEKESLLSQVEPSGAIVKLASPLIMLFNRNPAIVECGSRLLISQVALYPAFGLCYMMTITFQTIGASRYGWKAEILISARQTKMLPRRIYYASF